MLDYILVFKYLNNLVPRCLSTLQEKGLCWPVGASVHRLSFPEFDVNVLEAILTVQRFSI